MCIHIIADIQFCSPVFFQYFFHAAKPYAAAFFIHPHPVRRLLLVFPSPEFFISVCIGTVILNDHSKGITHLSHHHGDFLLRASAAGFYRVFQTVSQKNRKISGINRYLAASDIHITSNAFSFRPFK